MIIGTAGHIDHGKSALVEALTGRSMDPFADERRRGITLDLHVAPLLLDDAGIIGVVDVPGHEDLVRTMVAGAAGLDMVLLVVAADEGIMPQTREHLAVVEQLRVPQGIPVITKADLVEPEWLAMVKGEVSSWLRGSPVAFAPPVATSARTGMGMAALKTAIQDLAAGAPRRRTTDDLARLPVDRAFTKPGTGTVVTGTAWSGTFQVGDTVRILPADREARIRSLERHGETVARATAGERIAFGLTGLPLDAAGRGDVLVMAADPWQITTAVDVQIEILHQAAHPLRHQSRLRMHLGTAEVLARTLLTTPIAPGSSGLARLALEQPVVARGGDRIVIRSYSPVTVIGGGWILDPLPPKGRPRWTEGLADADHRTRLAALLGRRPAGLDEREVEQVLGVSRGNAQPLIAHPSLARIAGRIVLSGRVGEAMAAAREAVASYHVDHPSDPGMALQTLRQRLRGHGVAADPAIERLAADGELEIEGAVVRRTGFRPTVKGGGAVLERVVALVEEAGLAPPTVAEIAATLKIPGAADALRLAVPGGRVVAVERDRYYGRRALDEFTGALRQVAARGPITPSAVREATGVSRKYLIPLLEWADQVGLTVRRGDARVAGPALGGDVPPAGSA